jgi:hypothetical protein
MLQEDFGGLMVDAMNLLLNRDPEKEAVAGATEASRR